MKRVLLGMVFGSLAMASAAQDKYSGPSVEVRGSLFAIPARAYPMFDDDLFAYAGSYSMSNGEVMYLRRVGTRLVAEVGKRPAQKLVAVSANEFVSLDQKLRLTLNEGDDGIMKGKLLMIVPRSVADSGNGHKVSLIGAR